MAERDLIEQSTKTLPPPWDRIFSLGSRLFVWGLLFTILYILRPFFLLVFLTFVFAYILEHGVQGLQARIKKRPLRVVLVTMVFLGTLITIGRALAPAFGDQAKTLAQNYPKYFAAVDNEVAALRERAKWTKSFLPEDMHAAEVLEYLLGFVSEADPEETPAARGAARELAPEAPPAPAALIGDPDAPPPDVVLVPSTTDPPIPELQDPIGPPYPGAQAGAASTRTTKRKNLTEAMDRLRDIATPILGIGSAFLLSLLFSFLIVLDLPRLSRAVSGLANTKLGFIYDEVAGNIHDFGLMLGRALEAQLLIAICNTILTALGLWFLGLTSNLVFLSTIVFFCSFIPVAGVFLSSTPICIEALSSGGVHLMLFAILMILAIHTVEAYILNPKIFGHHLRMNAVLVLIVLTIGGKLFGVWGLVLGLPVVNYVFGHAIRFRQPQRGESKGVAA
jgi:predicted PurR-regulated permease PerM